MDVFNWRSLNGVNHRRCFSRSSSPGFGAITEVGVGFIEFATPVRIGQDIAQLPALGSTSSPRHFLGARLSPVAAARSGMVSLLHQHQLWTLSEGVRFVDEDHGQRGLKKEQLAHPDLVVAEGDDPSGPLVLGSSPR